MLTEYSKTYIPSYPQFVDICKKHEKTHWHEGEVELSTDVEQYQTGKMTLNDKALAENVLRLFTQSDVEVGAAYYDILIPTFKNNEVRNMLGSFAAREGVHQRAYALLNDTLGYSDDFYLDFLSYTSMKKKVEFMRDMKKSSHSEVGLSLARQVFCEGVLLFASFAMLLNFERYGKMPGMCDVVRWSIVDESIHIEGNSLLFREYLQDHPRIVNDEFKSAIYRMAEEMVTTEDCFIRTVFDNISIEGITESEVKQYIRAITDYRLLQLGLKPIFKVENPFKWIDELVGTKTLSNFFERATTDYSKDNFTGSYQTGY